MFYARPFKGTRSGLGSGGFTLPEMAIVVVISGLLLVTLLPALRATQSAAALSATQSNLQTLLRATAAYVAANGCLPCPTSGGNISGAESGVVSSQLVVDGKLMRNTPCGSCDSLDGIPPFVSMGLDAATAKDGWGRWITMHVDPALTNPTACSGDEKTANALGCSKNDSLLTGFCRPYPRTPAEKKISLRVQLATQGTAFTSVVFLSHGANGFGAYRTPKRKGVSCSDDTRLGFPANASCSGGKPSVSHGEEVCNDKCLTPDELFYEIQRGENFDDILAYADRNALVSMLGSGSCTTPW